MKIDITELHFDTNNYRGWNDINYLFSDSLAKSIASNGWLEYKPLLVALEDGNYVVLDGNHRLYCLKALKGLVDANRNSKTIEAIIKHYNPVLPEEIACVLVDRKDVLSYLFHENKYAIIGNIKILQSLREQGFAYGEIANRLGVTKYFVTNRLVGSKLFESVPSEEDLFREIIINMSDILSSEAGDSLGISEPEEITPEVLEKFNKMVQYRKEIGFWPHQEDEMKRKKQDEEMIIKMNRKKRALKSIYYALQHELSDIFENE